MGVFLRVSTLRKVPQSLPHARGGVSTSEKNFPCWTESSPRTWGCFPPQDGNWRPCEVFPTHVGVFLDTMTRQTFFVGLPHARGGVSGLQHQGNARWLSSPRTWGCFWIQSRRAERGDVFPTHVGVFPSGQDANSPGTGLPHARGGVSTRTTPGRSSPVSSPRTWGCFLAHLSHLGGALSLNRHNKFFTSPLFSSGLFSGFFRLQNGLEDSQGLQVDAQGAV